MESLRYRTHLTRNGTIPLPQNVSFSEETEVEVIVRPLPPNAPQKRSKDQVVNEIEQTLGLEFPNLKGKIGKDIRSIVGISDDVAAGLGKFSDKELLEMAKMEKHLEKGEIIENLY